MNDMKTVKAGVLLIGDELLSGRTQDTNLGTIARFLAPLGVQIGEARILPDQREVIIETVRDFAARFDYVFTTGGIGPTHDDITAECIAAAFDRKLEIRDDALEMMLKHYKKEDLNEARLRMAHIPDGASLIDNPVSFAPGFQTENVFTMAGVPRIMKAMLNDIADRIQGGTQLKSISINAPGIGEGDAAEGLAEIQKSLKGVAIGSYPKYDTDKGGYRVQFVARSHDEAALDQAKIQIEGLIKRLLP